MAASDRIPLTSVPLADQKPPGGLDLRTYLELKHGIHRYLLGKLDLDKIAQPDDHTRFKTLAVIEEIVARLKAPFSPTEQERISQEILQEVFGLGPLEPLLQDPTISDILVNGAKQVYVERRGLLELTSVNFRDDQHLLRIIDKIVSQVGRRIDESTPMVDARLLDGSRVNAIIPPLAVDGPLLSIRRF